MFCNRHTAYSIYSDFMIQYILLDLSGHSQRGADRLRIVVFSDSHNNFFVLKNIVIKQATADLFLHLGDGEREFQNLCEMFPEKFMRGVRGNCDWCSTGKLSDLVSIAGKRVFFTHGHAYGVKSGLGDLARGAESQNADIVLYGHTHIAVCEYRDGVHYMNPGSVTSPQLGSASYGVVDITGAGIVTNIVNL